MILRAPLPCLVLALLATAACAPSDDGERTGDPSRADTRPLPERAAGLARLHLLAFNKLQGFGAGIPCDPTRGAPVAQAATLARALEDEGDGVIFAAIGDTFARKRFQPVDRTQSASVRARRRVGVEALAAAGVEVLVPGHADLVYGARALVEQCEESGIEILLTNVTIEGVETRDTLLVEHGGVRIGLVSALPTLVPGEGGEPIDVEYEGVELANPTERVREVSERLVAEQGADLVICLSNLQAQANRDLTRIPSVHIVVGGAEGTPAEGVTFDPGSRSALLLSSATNGAELGHTTFVVRDGDLAFADVSGRYTLPPRIARDREDLDGFIAEFGTDDVFELAPRVSPEDPQGFVHWVAMIDENAAALAEIEAYAGSSIAHRAADLDAQPEAPAVLEAFARLPAEIEITFDNLAMPDEPFLGETRLSPPRAEDCRGCHAVQYAHWEGTRHARAFESVDALGLARDVTCLRCHTTAFNEPGGYTDLRQRAPYGSVQCYACHGTNKMHADSELRVVDPSQHFWRDAAAMDCVRCHREERSPGFDVAAATAQVACPPLDRSAPEMVAAYERVLAVARERRVQERGSPRDPYFEARALLALGREDEAFPMLDEFAPRATSDPLLTIEIAELFEDAGRSHGAIEILRRFVEIQTGEPNVNRAFVAMLLEASDETARDPERALRQIRFLLPEDGNTTDITLRLLEVDALFALDRADEATALMNRLYADYARTPEYKQRVERYGLRPIR